MDEVSRAERRDFLFFATAGAGAVAAGTAFWPLINQMNPSADVEALSSITVDISSLTVGSQLTVKWRGKPVFIRFRPEQEILAAREEVVEDLPDQVARNPNLDETAPATDDNRAALGQEQYLVMIGVCTHLGASQWAMVRETLAVGSVHARVSPRYSWTDQKRP